MVPTTLRCNAFERLLLTTIGYVNAWGPLYLSERRLSANRIYAQLGRFLTWAQ